MLHCLIDALQVLEGDGDFSARLLKCRGRQWVGVKPLAQSLRVLAQVACSLHERQIARDLLGSCADRTRGKTVIGDFTVLTAIGMH